MTSSTRIAVFGIGSTNLRAAVGTPDGTLVTAIERVDTRIEGLCAQVQDQLVALRETAGPLDAVSIACGGPVADGHVREMTGPDGETVRDIPLGPAVANAVGLPVRLENDCTAAALAEWAYGAGSTHDADCVVHCTMGTGIGAGVIDGGRVLRGASGQAAEVGFFPIGPPERDSCGVPGAWEAYCSGRGIAELARERLRDEARATALPAPDAVTAPDVFVAARDGDAVANELLEAIGEYTAAGLAAVINAYNPGVLTIGGGVGASNFEVLMDRARPHLEQYAIPSLPVIEATELGDEIGLYGALAPYAMATDETDASAAVEAGAAPDGGWTANE